MASTIKVDNLEGSTSSTVTVPTGQSLVVTDGLGIATGGTGLTSFTAGDILYATGATTLVKLAKGTTEQTLKMNTAASAPEYGTANAIAGGTAQTTWAQGDILYASAADTLTRLTKGSGSDTLKMNSGATAPEWVTVAAAASGLLQIKQTVSTSAIGKAGSTGAYTNLFSVDITPAATANKILLIADLLMGGTSGYAQGLMFVRDSTDIYITTENAGSRTAAGKSYAITSTSHQMNVNMVFLDDPSTTSAITYRVHYMGGTGNSIYLNRSSSDPDQADYGRGASSLTAIEIDSGAL